MIDDQIYSLHSSDPLAAGIGKRQRVMGRCPLFRMGLVGVNLQCLLAVVDGLLKALGIDWNKDFSREKLGAGPSVAALKDNKIQAFFWSGAVPTSSIIDMAATPGRKLVLLPVDGEIREKIFKANPGVFHPTVFKKGSYTGIDADVPAIAITAVLTAMDKFPQDKMYAIVKTIFDSKLELSAVWKGANDMTPATAVNQVTPDAFNFCTPARRNISRSRAC